MFNTEKNNTETHPSIQALSPTPVGFLGTEALKPVPWGQKVSGILDDAGEWLKVKAGSYLDRWLVGVTGRLCAVFFFEENGSVTLTPSKKLTKNLKPPRRVGED